MPKRKWRCPECDEHIEEPRRRGPHVAACRRSKGARYIYKDGDHSHPYEWITCIECSKRALVKAHGKGFCSKRCAQSGSNNTLWKGEGAGYMSKHQRQYRALGKADHCVFGCQADRYEWANLNADNDDAGGWGFASMCVGCHRNYDNAIAKCFPKTCSKGHILVQETMYVKIRNGREVRQCKQCAKDRANARRK